MTIRSYLELCKLRIGMMIALTAMVGYSAVAREIDVSALLLLGLAMVLGSASSSVFNHFYDRDLDRLMTRTARRPLASGAMRNPHWALLFAGGLLVAGLSLAGGAFNWAVAVHLFLGAFIYGVVYTVWLKRRTWLNIVIGRAAVGGAVPYAPLQAAVGPLRPAMRATLVNFRMRPLHPESATLKAYRAARERQSRRWPPAPPVAR
jgi:protoheme IX farnesyltransferase